MDRERATKQLVRIIATLEAGGLPAAPKELHVFGSYARGALEPGDLDLILIHDPPAKDLMERLEAEIVEKYGNDRFYWPSWPRQRFEARMRGAIRKPGEKMDILLGTSLEEALQYRSAVAKSHRVLLWSTSDRDWVAKLNSIAPDPSASRFPRDYFAPIQLFRTNVETMRQVTKGIKDQVLKLTRIPIESVDPKLNPLYERWLEHWRECKVMGKETMKVLPYGMWWLQQQPGQKSRRPDVPDYRAIMESENSRYVVHFGRPHLYQAFFFSKDRCRKICFIPHLKRDHTNEMYVFERGCRWTASRCEKLARTFDLPDEAGV
jgi:hypothetical protein